MSELDPALEPKDPPPSDPPADPPPASDPPAGDPPAGDPPKSDWPDDWREQLAGDDETFLRHLKRYSSPQTFAKGFKEREDLIRSGKIKRDMPDPSDANAFAEWRKEQGIPDDPTGYKLPDEVTKRLTDADKPILANFTEFAHTNNMPPAFVEKAAEWYTMLSEQAAEKQASDDAAASERCEDTLRKDWAHGEYKANLTLGKRFLENIPGVGSSWSEARLPDGRRLGDIPDFVTWAADMGRDRFGDSVFATPDSERVHMARKDEIKKIMREDIERYYREGLDREYASILSREEKRRS